MYFNSIFPKIKYDPTGNGNPIEIQDILTRIVTRKNVASRNVLFAEYISVFSLSDRPSVYIMLYFMTISFKLQNIWYPC